MSKGSKRRPGIIPPTAWERIFHPDKCATCGELKAKCECVATDDGLGQVENKIDKGAKS